MRLKWKDLSKLSKFGFLKKIGGFFEKYFDYFLKIDKGCKLAVENVSIGINSEKYLKRSNYDDDLSIGFHHDPEERINKFRDHNTIGQMYGFFQKMYTDLQSIQKMLLAVWGINYH